MSRIFGSENHEQVFLEGPSSRKSELGFVFRMAKDFIKGFRVFHFVGPCITVFGSARIEEGHPYYELGLEVGASISKLGFTVMTGGGPGLSGHDFFTFTLGTGQTVLGLDTKQILH